MAPGREEVKVAEESAADSSAAPKQAAAEPADRKQEAVDLVMETVEALRRDAQKDTS